MTKNERATRKYSKLQGKKEAAEKKIKDNVNAEKAGTSKKSNEQQQIENLAAKNKSKRMQNRMNRVANRQGKVTGSGEVTAKDSNKANVYALKEAGGEAKKKPLGRGVALRSAASQLASSASNALKGLNASKKYIKK